MTRPWFHLPARLGTGAAACLLAACGSTPLSERMHPMPAPGTHAARPHPIDSELPAMPRAGSGRGAYYKDDGPGDNPPPNLRDVADAEVRAEPYSRYANRPYTVFGKLYTPRLDDLPFVQRGISTWYGKKFHGQRTSSGELYDMYKMTAAHPTLPIPSFARITSLDTGKQVVVRINDRGPFHSSRIVDVSYTAALKLGLLGKVIGFSILALQISQIESFDPSQTQTLLKSLTGGLGVALLTTAVGLVGNIVLGFQLVRLDRCADGILADALYFVETDLQSGAR